MIKKSIVGLVVGLWVMAAANTWAQTQSVLDTGDPAERVCNPKSYTDLGNGIVRDNVTGLEWQKEIAPDLYNWLGAVGYCSSVTLGGYSDWRLPTIKELSTLVDAGRYYPSIETAYFPDTATYYYWSYTTDAYNFFYAWFVDSSYSFVDYFSTYDYLLVRAVRGGPLQTINNFVDNGDGTITDTTSGLMWQKEIAPDLYNWQGAVEYCSSVTLGGYSDWRLPTRNELQSLVDYSRYDPATTFPNMKALDYNSYDHWSSTTYAGNPGYGWIEDFYYGYVGASDKNDLNYVRAVRGGTCLFPVECNGASDCNDDQFCNGAETCVSGLCVTGTDPCSQRQECDEVNNVCTVCSLGQSLDAEEISWDTGGDVEWSCQYDVSYFGGSATASGPIINDQATWLETTVTGPGTGSFYWKVSSEQGYDHLKFFIDDTFQHAISGDVLLWQLQEYSLPAGTHTLKWQYSKDAYGGRGLDRGWVDKVVWLPSPCNDNADCDDGAFCNGAETCIAGECVGGPGNPCEADETCDESIDECLCGEEWDLDVDCDVDKDDANILKLQQKAEKTALKEKHTAEKAAMKAALGSSGDCDAEWDLNGDCNVDKEDSSLLKLRQKEEKTALKEKHTAEKAAMKAAL